MIQARATRRRASGEEKMKTNKGHHNAMPREHTNNNWRVRNNNVHLRAMQRELLLGGSTRSPNPCAREATPRLLPLPRVWPHVPSRPDGGRAISDAHNGLSFFVDFMRALFGLRVLPPPGPRCLEHHICAAVFFRAAVS